MVTHGGFIGEFLNVVRKLSGRAAVYNNSAKNTAMYIIKFERNAKGGLKARILLENDNAHLLLKINPTDTDQEDQEEEKKAVPVDSIVTNLEGTTTQVVIEETKVKGHVGNIQ